MKKEPEPKLQPVNADTQIPNLTVVEAGYGKGSLNDLSKKNGLVLSFIHGTWCPACVQQLVRSNKFAADLAAYEVAFVAVVNDALSHVNAFKLSSQPPLSFPLLADDPPQLAKTFGIFDELNKRPHLAIFYLDTNGKVLSGNLCHNHDCFPLMRGLIDLIQETT